MYSTYSVITLNEVLCNVSFRKRNFKGKIQSAALLHQLSQDLSGKKQVLHHGGKTQTIKTVSLRVKLLRSLTATHTRTPTFDCVLLFFLLFFFFITFHDFIFVLSKFRRKLSPQWRIRILSLWGVSSRYDPGNQLNELCLKCVH